MKKVCVKIAAGVFAAFAAGSFVGCGSTNETVKVETSNAARPVAIDWKGASVGSSFPEWLAPALNNDIDALPASIKKQLNGKHFVIIEKQRVRKDNNSTKDLELAQELATSQYMTDIARSLNSAAGAKFHSVLSESEMAQFTESANAAKARFSGFNRIADSWVLNRFTDKQKETITDTYTVVQIWACDESLWREQAAVYIRNLLPNTESESMRKAAEMADELAASLQPGIISGSQM